jgi:hypothetical protein
MLRLALVLLTAITAALGLVVAVVIAFGGGLDRGGSAGLTPPRPGRRADGGPTSAVAAAVRRPDRLARPAPPRGVVLRSGALGSGDRGLLEQASHLLEDLSRKPVAGLCSLHSITPSYPSVFRCPDDVTPAVFAGFTGQTPDRLGAEPEQMAFESSPTGAARTRSAVTNRTVGDAAPEVWTGTQLGGGSPDFYGIGRHVPSLGDNGSLLRVACCRTLRQIGHSVCPG